MTGLCFFFFFFLLRRLLPLLLPAPSACCCCVGSSSSVVVVVWFVFRRFGQVHEFFDFFVPTQPAGATATAARDHRAPAAAAPFENGTCGSWAQRVVVVVDQKVDTAWLGGSSSFFRHLQAVFLVVGFPRRVGQDFESLGDGLEAFLGCRSSRILVLVVVDIGRRRDGRRLLLGR